MYIHIGGEYTISARFIVGIFDFDSVTAESSETIAFIRHKEQHEMVEMVSPDIPRSIIVTLDKVYISPISAATLRQRIETDQIIIREGA